MEEKKTKRKLTTILSADVKGYSHLMQDNEEATVRTITAYREVMTNLIQGHDGRVVDAKGDNLLAEFPSVVDAVRCGVEIQKELKVRNAELPEQRRMEVSFRQACMTWSENPYKMGYPKFSGRIVHGQPKSKSAVHPQKSSSPV